MGFGHTEEKPVDFGFWPCAPVRDVDRCVPVDDAAEAIANLMETTPEISFGMMQCDLIPGGQFCDENGERDNPYYDEGIPATPNRFYSYNEKRVRHAFKALRCDL